MPGDGHGSDLRIRSGARAVIIDRDGRILLVRWDFPDRPELGYPPMSVWGTPAAASSPTRTWPQRCAGSSPRSSASTTSSSARRSGTASTSSRSSTAAGTASTTASTSSTSRRSSRHRDLSVEQLRAEHLVHIRWWTQDELASFVPTDTELFAPRKLPQLVAALLADGVPDSPIETGV